MILAVGYRTNSKKAIAFRQWATKTLKDHIYKGYTINKNRIQKNYDDFLKTALLESLAMSCNLSVELYSSIEEKAANLLYFIVKNHPFVDGNKRSGAYAFICFYAKQKHWT